jgi:hypothetical protein
MIAVAMVNNKPEMVLDYHQLLDMIQRDYQLDAQDVASLIQDAVEHYNQHPELEAVCETAVEIFTDNAKNSDGIFGDAFYIAEEQIQNAQEEIRAEIENLRSTSRKGNTKEDIAKRLENIVSNMDGIL